MLFEIAIGDAYGAGFEFATRDDEARPNTASRYYKNPGFAIGNGRYTDDTQMSLAVAEVLLDQDFTPAAFANRFFDAFKRDPRLGYSKFMYKTLMIAETVDHWLGQMNPTSGNGSGSAMRAVPIGVLPDLRDVLRIATLQAQVTHNTDVGIISAMAVAAAAHFGRYVRDGDVADYLNEHVGIIDWREPYSGEVTNNGIEVARAAITAVRASEGFTDVLKNAVDFGGDVDSVAAVGLGLASQLGYANDLNQVLISELENGVYGRDYLRSVDVRLDDLYATRSEVRSFPASP